MTRAEFDSLQMARRPRMDDLAVNEYGDRAYGTPEETIWNDAFERARARIEHPRWEGLGTVPGGMDSPENVDREVFEPVMQAFEPQLAVAAQSTRNRNALDLERQSILRDQQARLADELAFKRDQEKRVAAQKAQDLARREREALNDFNLRSSRSVSPKTKAEEYAIRTRVGIVAARIKQAQAALDPKAEAAATAELDALLNKYPGMSDALGGQSASPVMPSFEINPAEVTPTVSPPMPEAAPQFPATNSAQPMLPPPVTMPAPTVTATNQPSRADIEQLRAQAMESVKRKGRAAVAARFKQLTGEEL